MKCSLLFSAAVFAALLLAGSAVSFGATIGSGPAPQMGIQPTPQPPAPGGAQFPQAPPLVQPPPPVVAPPPVDPVTLLTDDQRDWYHKIRELAFTSLSSTSMADFRDGEQKLLAIKEPEALEPMALALYTSNTRWRSSFLQAVNQYARSGAAPSNRLAVVYLEDIAVKDDSGVLRSKARATLLAKDTPRETSRIKYQLSYSHDPAVRDRAAGLLADLKDQTALANLVDVLTTEQTSVNGAWIESRSVQLDIRAATAQLQGMTTIQEGAAAAGGAANGTTGTGIVTAGQAIGNLMLPTVHIAEVHTTVAAPGGFTVTPDVEQKTITHPEILSALKQLTGQDFGYDKAAWMNWITSGHGDQKSNSPSGADWVHSK